VQSGDAKIDLFFVEQVLLSGIAQSPGFVSSRRRRRFGFALTLLSLIAIAWLTLRPAHASLTPLDSHLCLICGELAGVDILLNIALFVPLGVGLSLTGLSPWKTVLTCFAISLSIEISQAFFIPGRDATLSDVLTNTAGGALGVWLTRTAPVWLAPSRKNAMWLSAMWAATWLLVQIASSYVFAPSLPTTQYYGQLARELGGMAGFPGEVRSARIGTMPIPNDEFTDSRSMRELLLNGAPIVGVVHLTEPTRYFAPIIRVADEKQREITSISENGDQLAFSVRTGASNLRLRQPGVALSAVFVAPLTPPDSAAQTMVITARFSDATMHIDAQSPSTHRELNVSPRAALAWTAMVPFQWYIENTTFEHLATFLWASILLVPLGYWAAGVAHQSKRRPTLTLIVVVAAILAAGMILVPGAFHLSAATVLDWIAALFGLGVGAALTLLHPAESA
jgi:glycopeptide antibiotics resistance protein